MRYKQISRNQFISNFMLYLSQRFRELLDILDFANISAKEVIPKPCTWLGSLCIGGRLLGESLSLACLIQNLLLGVCVPRGLLRQVSIGIANVWIEEGEFCGNLTGGVKLLSLLSDKSAHALNPSLCQGHVIVLVEGSLCMI